MTVTIIPVDLTTDTFLDLISKTNSAINAITFKAVTVDSNNAVGHAGITGSLSANTVYASEIFGGVRGNTAPIAISSNTSISGNTSFTGANNYFSTIGSIHVPGANSTHRTLLANNSTNKLYYGELRNEITLVDGAGSGIDSDLLDGQQGAWYIDIPARQGYTSVNKAGDTITGALSVTGNTTLVNTSFTGSNTAFAAITNIYIPGSNTTHRTVFANNTSGKLYYGELRNEITLIDGAGSGIDSDLLDGQQGAWYIDIPARQGYTSVNKAGDTITGALTVSGNTSLVNTSFSGTNTAFSSVGSMHVPGSNATHKALFANTSTNKLYYGELRNEITLIDGAGSLIDSDFLDGQQGAWYTDIPARQGYTSVNKAGDTITGALAVNGATSVANTLNVSGASTFGSSVTVQSTVFSANTTYSKFANTVGIDFNSSRFVSNTTSVGNTTATVIHQFSKAEWNTVKYVLSILNTTDNTVMATEILVISDTTSNVAHSTQYATISSNNVFGEFTVDNTAANTRLIFTASEAKTLVLNYTASHVK